VRFHPPDGGGRGGRGQCFRLGNRIVHDTVRLTGIGVRLDSGDGGYRGWRSTRRGLVNGPIHVWCGICPKIPRG
jgi:hypothetical protein